MSERVERRLVELLDHPRHSPYGNPIPGLDELGDPSAPEGFLDGVVSLVAHTRTAPGSSEVVVGRLGEPLQTDPELLQQLVGAGVLPGARVRVEVVDGMVAVGAPGAELVLDLPEDVARHVFVAATGPSAD